MPHCPVCKSMLGGNGSVILPYYCECGEWKPKDVYDFKGEYEIITPSVSTQSIKCMRCNDNGCPSCENIKWNIKD